MHLKKSEILRDLSYQQYNFKFMHTYYKFIVKKNVHLPSDTQTQFVMEYTNHNKLFVFIINFLQ